METLTQEQLTPDQERVMRLEAQLAREKLTGGKRQRLTDKPDGVGIDHRTTDEKIKDKAVLDTALTVVRSNTVTREAVKATIMSIMGRKLGLGEAAVEVLTDLAYQNGLDPNPASGHLYVWYDTRRVKKDNQWVDEKFMVMYIGYQAYIYKAHQQFSFQFLPTREMTAQERELHDLKPDDKGVVVSLLDFKAAKQFHAVGMTPIPLEAVGIWRKEAYFNRKKNEWMEDNTPNTWSSAQMAEKRGITNVLKRIGVKFNWQLPDVEGLRYDPDTNSILIPAPNAPDPDDDDVIDGDFDFDDSPTEPEKVEAAPVVKRNGKHGDGKPSYTKIEEPEAEIENGEQLADILETDDPTETVEDVSELPPLGKQQIGKIRHTINKTFSNPEERASVEAEIVATYSAESLETVPSIRFKEIIATLESKQPKVDVNGKPNGAAALPRNKLASPLEITEMNVLIKEYLIILDELPADESKQGDAIKAKFVELFDKEPAMIERSKVYWIKDQITQKTMEVVKAQNAESES